MERYISHSSRPVTISRTYNQLLSAPLMVLLQREAKSNQIFITTITSLRAGDDIKSDETTSQVEELTAASNKNKFSWFCESV